MSFKEVYEKYYAGLVRFGLQLNVNRVDAEDLAQETFLRYHVAISKDVDLNNTRAGRSEVHAFLSTLYEGESSISIPLFDPEIKRIRFRRRKPISLLWKVAAGIALLIGLFWIIQSRLSSSDLTPDQADLLLLELMGDVEPNKAWHNGQVGIIILDEKGDILQSFISNDTE